MTGPQKLAALRDGFETDAAGIRRLVVAGDAAGLGRLLMAERTTRFDRDTRDLRARIAGGKSATVTDEEIRQIVDSVFRFRGSEIKAMRMHEIAAALQEANSDCRELSIAWLARRLGRLKIRNVASTANDNPAVNLSLLR